MADPRIDDPHRRSGPAAVRRSPAGQASLGDRIRTVAMLVALHLHVGVVGGAIWTKGVFFPSLSAAFGLGHAAVAALFSLGSLIGGVVTLAGGWALARRFPPRSYLVGTSLIVGLGYGVAGLATSHGQLILSSVLQSAGAGYLVAIPFLIDARFTERRGILLASAMTGANTGSMILSPIVAHVVAIDGWRAGYGILCALTCLLIAPLLAFGIGAARGPSTAPQGGERRRAGSLLAVIATWQYWALLVVNLLYTASVTSAVIHFVPALVRYGHSLSTAAMAMGGLFLIAAVSKIGFGYFGDKLKNHGLTLAAILILCSMGLIFFSLYNDHENSIALAGFLLFFGSGFSAPVIILPLLASKIFGRENFAFPLATMLSAGLISSALGSVFTGWIYDTMKTYWPAFATFSVLLLAAAALAAACGLRERARAGP